jgi:hypothetical protein
VVIFWFLTIRNVLFFNIFMYLQVSSIEQQFVDLKQNKVDDFKAKLTRKVDDLKQNMTRVALYTHKVVVFVSIVASLSDSCSRIYIFPTVASTPIRIACRHLHLACLTIVVATTKHLALLQPQVPSLLDNCCMLPFSTRIQDFVPQSPM